MGGCVSASRDLNKEIGGANPAPEPIKEETVHNNEDVEIGEKKENYLEGKHSHKKSLEYLLNEADQNEESSKGSKTQEIKASELKQKKIEKEVSILMEEEPKNLTPTEETKLGQ